MSSPFLDKWLPWREYDPTTVNVYKHDVTRYEVTHLNGNVTEAVGHEDTRDGAFCKIWLHDDETWSNITMDRGTSMGYEAIKPIFTHQSRYADKVADLEGIESIDETVIGVDTWEIEVDVSQREILDVTRERELYDE